MTPSLVHLAVFAVAIVALAALQRLVPNPARKRLPRCVVLLGLYAVSFLGMFASTRTGLLEVARGFEFAGTLLGVLLSINLLAFGLFDVLLHLARWDYPDILHDLVIGAAYLVAIGWLMHHAGVNVTSIVATSAVVTAVLGLSLQATLGNIVGGLALQVDESFGEGDWIEFDNKLQARVSQIRWRHTVLETRDYDTLIVPNGQLMAQTIRVLGKRGGESVPHRCCVYFGVDFRHSPTEVIRVVSEALTGAPIANVASTPPAVAACLDLARDGQQSYVYYGAFFWVVDMGRNDSTQSSVRERIYSALRRAQLPLAVPAQTIFLSHDDQAHAERKQQRGIEARTRSLGNVEIFAHLADDERAHLAEASRFTPFAPGEVITRQGAQAHWLYVLTRGRAEVRVRTDDGAERSVAVLSAPSFFGEMALMTGQPREATVHALTEVECLRVDKDDFRGILRHRPEMAEGISEILAKRRVELESVREGLDVTQKRELLNSESRRILTSIKGFFGL